MSADAVVDRAERGARVGGSYAPATQPTIHFIGVTTGGSSIMRVFPAWSEELELGAVIQGIDLAIHAPGEQYLEVVSFIKSDPLSLGALVTTHKLDLYKAARSLFDVVGPETEILDEVSSISKRDGALWGHAMDPMTSGLSLQAIVPDGYWTATSGEMLILGAGGSSLALTLHLHRRHARGADVPQRIVVTNRTEARLAEMRAIHQALGFGIAIEYHHTPRHEDNDARLETLRPGSMVINATGLGKDAPGSPLTDAATFPTDGIAWDFNYRGDLKFLVQARAQSAARHLSIEDGWLYFIHGWTRVVAEVFHTSIPTSGPAFDRLCRIAQDAAKGART